MMELFRLQGKAANQRAAQAWQELYEKTERQDGIGRLCVAAYLKTEQLDQAATILEHLTEPSKTRLVGVKHSIYGLLPANVGRPRSITAVPKVDDAGVTVGVWFFDSASDTILFLNDLQNATNLKLRVVEIGGGG